MIRVETSQSQEVKNQIEALKASLFFDNNNRWTMATKPAGIYTSYANSTRSIYITVRSHTSDNEVSIRVSDHIRGLRRDSKDIEVSFADFDINRVEELYNEMSK